MIIAVSILLASSFKAQDKMDSKMDTKMSRTKIKNCVMMEGGKMMQRKDGKTMTMEKDMKISNGSMVMTDGTMKMKNEKRRSLTIF